MAGFGLAGLASGVDTHAIVAQLMALERQGITRNKMRDKGVEAREAGLRELQGKLNSLKLAAQALTSPDAWSHKQSVTSSDPARVGVTRTGMVPAGGYSIEVRELASAEREGFAYTMSPEASRLTVDGVDVDIAAGAGASDVASAVNGRGDLAVYATALGDGTIVFSARKTGTAGSFEVSGAQLTADPAHTKPARDAEYSVDGGLTWASSSTQTVENVIPGVTLTLKALTDTPVTIDAALPALDKDAVREKFRAFVSAYNDVVTSTRLRLDEKSVRDPQFEYQAAKGALFGDIGLSSVLSGLRQLLSTQSGVTTDPAAPRNFMDLGISTGKASGGASTTDAKQGKLVLDEGKLMAALDDPDAVRRLLGGTAEQPGLLQGITSLVDRQAGADGVLAERMKATSAERARLGEQSAEIERRIAAKEKRLRSQFALMESALGQAQAQQTWLSAQLAAFKP